MLVQYLLNGHVVENRFAHALEPLATQFQQFEFEDHFRSPKRLFRIDLIGRHGWRARVGLVPAVMYALGRAGQGSGQSQGQGEGREVTECHASPSRPPRLRLDAQAQ